MAKAKKLPSGSWRVQLFVGKTPEGKNRYKSFTADTRKEAEFLAAQYALDQHEEQLKENEPDPLPFEDAARMWINNRRNILSPSTTRMYDSMLRNAYSPILTKSVYDLTLSDIQSTINAYAADHAPKSVQNAFGLLSSVIKHYNSSLILTREKLNLPSSEDHEITVPEDAQVTSMILHLRSLAQRDDMLIVVLLAATLGLRRSEICALTQDDFQNGTVRISHALVLSYDNKTYVIKGTKSKAGRRTLKVNPDVYNIIKNYGSDPTTGRIISTTPARVTCRYATLAKRFGVPGTLHDLRHYYASILSALNIPVKYAMKRMGHSTPQVTERVYQHTLSTFDERFDKAIDTHTDQLLAISHEISHEDAVLQ